MKKYSKIWKFSFCLIGISICLGIVFWRAELVNKAAGYPINKYYSRGEIVPMDKNVFEDINVDMSGYSIGIVGAQFYSIEDYLKKYEIDEDEYKLQYGKSEIPKKICEVTVKIENKDNTQGGIDFWKWRLQGIDQYAQMESYLYRRTEPELNGSEAISMKINWSRDFVLPYALFEENFKEQVWNDIENYKMFLVVSEIPNSIRLRIN